VFERTGLSKRIGPVNLYRTAELAIATIAQRTSDPSIETCLMPRPGAGVNTGNPAPKVDAAAP
jgi:hypothetical protein